MINKPFNKPSQTSFDGNPWLVVKQRNKFAKFDSVGIIEIYNFKTKWSVERGKNAVYNICDVCVIAPCGAIAKQFNRLTGKNGAGEFVDGKIGALP